MILYASFYGVQILRYWDIRSGSEIQLSFERRTYLISTIMAYAFGFQLLSFFLFIYTADSLYPFFTGAMCAVGSLNVDRWGFPVVVMKIVTFLAGGVWLIINYTDNQGYDYPLIKAKYLVLLVIAPLIVIEAIIQFKYFQGLNPEIITSCCGSVFTADAKGVASEIITFPGFIMEIAFYGSMIGAIWLGYSFYQTGNRGYLFSAMVLLTFLISIASIISFISIYIYELPTHHCPFCILQKEYGYIGYVHVSGALGGKFDGPGSRRPHALSAGPELERHVADDPKASGLGHGQLVPVIYPYRHLPNSLLKSQNVVELPVQVECPRNHQKPRKKRHLPGKDASNLLIPKSNPKSYYTKLRSYK